LADVVTVDGSEEEDVLASGDEISTFEHLTGGTTRSGRESKRVKTFTIPEAKKRKRAPKSNSISLLSGKKIDPQLVPPGGMSHELLEDTETGQRLLLVKSPPPVGSAHNKDGSNEFVHVYLMSPSAHRQRPCEASDVASQGVTIPDTGEVFVPPSVASPAPVLLQEEIITEDVQVIDLDVESDNDLKHVGYNMLPKWPHENSQSGSQYSSPVVEHDRGVTECTTSEAFHPIDLCISTRKSTPPQPHTPVCKPDVHSQTLTLSQTNDTLSPTMQYTELITPEWHSPQYSQKPTSTDDTSCIKSIKDEDRVQEVTQQEVSQLYENANILTVTNTEGQVIEILIEPGFFTKEEVGDLKCDTPEADVKDISENVQDSHQSSNSETVQDSNQSTYSETIS
jgi:hypothetical protein